MKYRIGLICPSEIAYRRFMPSLIKSEHFEFVGLAKAKKEEWFDSSLSDSDFREIDLINTTKANSFMEQYGGNLYTSYEELITSKEIDAVYIPLPPALHFKWAKLALLNNLHVFVEKPSTTSLENTKELVEIARDRKLALHENYMFIFHSQIREIDSVIKSGCLGEIRLIRIDFGFPNRGKNDFRYNKNLGGGALLDCGGYVLKYADYLLGGDSTIISATLRTKNDYEVDLYGCGTMSNKNNEIVQFSFGMDNDYRCSIEIWGSEASLHSNRILTAPEGFEPTYQIIKNGEVNIYKMNSDDAFLKSINHFYNCICDENNREENYKTIIKQEILVDDFMKKCKGDS